eukprot:TRINITY_DN493_c0_g1::TRINITY_DN493_c0_g1_i1::g.2607::m.2607 TRINITY_DN493_c0_g1::TRINITY_DN493_c0_g1_i1::g.2607  ORF type:complete len:445 (+),score=76.11,sp/Q9X1K5/DCDA_THEMA/30.71/1e-39,Orn_Arg_deC_N/PF02784.11/6.7e-40,Orn_DAP_Arg_deC/PF00278.17/3.4e-12 TRINITY_DN493_c0_g1_i1:52-1335(+)
MEKTAVDMKIEQVLQYSIKKSLLDDSNPVAVFYDMTFFEENLNALKDAFSSNFFHAIALKANPLAAMVRALGSKGFGAECASMSEAKMASQAGIVSEKIVLDSPAKTILELKEALAMGIYLNLDNLDEVDRVRTLRSSNSAYHGRAGLRVNPQHGAGSIAITSTASKSSKFGEPLLERKAEILEAYRNNTWLCGVHIHVGSQGCSVQQLVQGAKSALELARDINAQCPGQITHIDIGGGLSVDYHGDSLGPTFHEYAAALREQVPDLFTPEFTVVTEFGRKVNAKVGWVAAHVEYVKTAGGKNIALTHAGADLFLRAVYQPEKWFHRLSAYDPSGQAKPQETLVEYDVGGPLCFSGDIIASGRALPRLVPGDWIVVHDAGAYIYAMHQKHTSQQAPAVYTYYEHDPSEITLIKPRETYDDVARFYGY